MKLNFLIGIVLIFVISVFLFFPGSAVTSSGGNFTVSTNVSFNWTFGNINITSNNDSVMLRIHNQSNTIQPQYFDEYKYSAGNYEGYDSAKILTCFTNGTFFLVQNSSSGTYTNITDPLNDTNSTIYNLIAYQYCPPGYYFGYYNVTQDGTGDYAKPNASVNVPVNLENTFSETNSTAFVKGTLVANTNLVHKYYFNTSLAENLTGVTINLSWDDYTKDIDLYLFNSSGNLLARSVENYSREEIYRDLPGTPDMWEIWIWGNVTSSQDYVANMYFTTLNVTNASNTNQEISSHDFGGLDPENNESSELNINISNVDTKTWTGVKERSEVYRVETWKSKNVTGDYYFLVPHFAEKVKAKIEWTGGMRWYISLNDSNGNFKGNSSEKYKTGNKTNTIQEENVLYSGTISTSNDGLWKITVGNLSVISDDKYNITVYIWSPGWVSSDYPSGGFNFNSSLGSDNSSKNVSLQITLPSINISNGTYEGFVEYYKPTEWNLRVPISFNVKAGTLLVNNTLNTVSETKYDNTGFNRLGANVLKLTLPINNTGGHNISFVNTTSNYTLSKGSYYMNFTVDHWPSNPIQAGSNDTIKINISINTSHTGNSAGLYTGLIELNTTNSSNASSSSYPFNVFDINLRVNLSNKLIVNITEITPATVPQTENASNMTLNITVHLANGSVVSTNEILNQSDFYSVYLKEGNRSYTTSTTLQNLSTSATGGTWSVVCPSGETYCRLNGTLLSSKPGGRYYAVASARLNTSKMGGIGINIAGTSQSSIQTVINDEGLYIINKGYIWVNDANPFDEGDYALYMVYVRNYGPTAVSNAEIMFNNPNSCEVTIIPSATNTSCDFGPDPTSSSARKSWNVSIPEYMGGTNCSLTWKVTANSVNLDQGYCFMNIGVASDHANYGNLTDIGVDVHDTTPTTDGGNGDGQQTGAECTSDSDCADTEVCSSGTCSSISCSNGYVTNHNCYSYADEFLITSYEEKVYVLQGGSNSTKVTVKNQGAYTRTTKFDAIINLTGLTTEVSPTSYTLASGNLGVFSVNFSTTNTTEIGYHEVTLKVYMSGNESIKTTKDITLAIQPLEETKKQINQTYDDLKELFDSLLSQFNQVPPSSEANYTLTNRTYNRLLSMFTDIEDKLKAGEYMGAYELLKEANSSITEFRQQIEQLAFESSQLPFDLLTLVAILVVIVVIGGFLVYLLLPPKKGFHPTLGYTPRKKISVVEKLKHLLSGVKKLKPGGKDQKTLGQYERPMPVEKPAPPLPEKPPEKKPYMEGYDRHEESGLSYKKKEMKPKKKWFGK